MKYADSGVNIDAATRALARSKEAIRSTWDSRVRNELGAFGGLFQPAEGEPLLVASVDGVGTKVMVANMVGRYDTVGQDLVNHCVDDILVQGIISRLHACGRKSCLKSSPGLPRAAVRTVAPFWAARRPRCPVSTERGSSTWPGLSSAGYAKRTSSTGAGSRPGTGSGDCPARGSTPTGIPWPGPSFWRRPASRSPINPPNSQVSRWGMPSWRFTAVI